MREIKRSKNELSRLLSPWGNLVTSFASCEFESAFFHECRKNRRSGGRVRQLTSMDDLVWTGDKGRSLEPQRAGPRRNVRHHGRATNLVSALVRSRAPNFCTICFKWYFTASSEMNSRCHISRFRYPPATRAKISSSLDVRDSPPRCSAGWSSIGGVAPFLPA